MAYSRLAACRLPVLVVQPQDGVLAVPCCTPKPHARSARLGLACSQEGVSFFCSTRPAPCPGRRGTSLPCRCRVRRMRLHLPSIRVHWFHPRTRSWLPPASLVPPGIANRLP